MQQRGAKRCQRHDAEQHEGGAGYEKTVERIGGVDRRIGDGGAGCGEDARDVRRRDLRERDRDLAPPRPFAGCDQRRREQTAEEDAHGRADQAGLDRILDEENPAEREREPADPDHPACAEALLEAFRRSGRLGRGRGRLRCVDDDVLDIVFVHSRRLRLSG
jgi:hypothetical protein